MPFLSRVLHPASKRKPPIRRQGCTSKPQCYSIAPTISTTMAQPRSRVLPTVRPIIGRSRRSGCTCTSIQHTLDTHERFTSSALLLHSHQSVTTFSDLYPVFRFILESRSAARPHRSSYTNHSRLHLAPSSISPILSRSSFYSPSTSTLVTNCSSQSSVSQRSINSAGTYLSPGTWGGRSIQSISKQFYSSLQTDLPRLHSTLPESRTVAISQLLPLPVPLGSRAHRSISRLGFKSTRHSRHTFSTIPNRSISHQHSTKALEDIPDLRIPEEFLPLSSIERAPLQSPTPHIFKNWILSQITHARNLFQEQNYMQALVVIEKAKEHSYIHDRQSFPYNTASALEARWHYQDLCLVEYCCRLLCAHEAQIGNIDIVSILQHLNESVLKPAGKFKSNSKIAFKTTFQLYQDPLLDYTLAIIAKNWNELPGALSTTLSSQLAFPERKVCASAIYPFLQAISDRRLFPSTTSIFQDITVAESTVSGSRRAVLDIYVTLKDRKGAMQWIWLWERMDRQDWLFQWKQLEFKQWLIDHFHQSNHSDWTAELFRLSNKALGTPKLWVQDLLDTIPNLDNPKNILPAILRQASIDISGFPSKKRYYQSDSWTHFDQIESWLSGILAVDILVPQKNCVVEQKLWREIAMIGILARDLRVEDVMQSVHLDVAAAIREDPSSVYLSHSTSGRYHDVLTSYLEETSATTLGMSYEGNQIHSGVNPTKESTKALAILQRAIQETVSSTHVQDTLDVYRNLLLSVAQNAAFRSRHLGLISQVTELKFRSLKGDSLWEQIKLASTLPHPSKKQKHDSSLKRDSSSSPLSSIADISDFADNYLRSDLAKMCAASTILTVDPNSRKWTGQFSNWFISLAESSVYTECLAKNLQYQGRLVPGSRAYDKAMWILLQNQEYDVAAALHCHAFLRKDTNNIRQPSTEEVRGLIHALVTSDDQKYLEKAQWIVEQHLNKSKPGSIDTVKYVSPIDISIMTNLAGAWSRRAEFDNVRNVIEIMKRHDIPPNMVFYNTILKSLVDLTPLSRPGKRTIGSGNQPRTRELGREIMVRQLLKWKRHCHEPQDSIKLQSDLEKGWHVFLDVASIDSSGKKTLVSEELGSPLMLKNLITMSRSSSRRRKGSYFWPDGHTFSILLGAFAKRGEIEPISELFVEMKRIGLEPDVVICNILANAFAKKGDLKSVNQVLHEARNRNMEPGLFLTNAVLDSLVESGASVVKIREILGAMINNDASPITSKLEANTHGSRIDFSRRQRHSVANGNQNHPDTTKLLPTRTSEGAQFESGLNNVAFTTLIKYHIRQNDLRSAQHVVQAMKEAEMALDNRAYVLLLSGSIKNRDIYAGLNTLRMMRAHSNIYPDAKAWKGLLRCALELQNPMQPTGRYQASDDGIVHSLSPNRPRDDPVFLVLKELSTVLDDIEQSGNDPIFRSTGIAESNRSKQQYLSNILTSSWIALPDKRKYSRWELEILNPEVKGKRSLLKRLLDHFLRPAISESSGSLISSSSAPLSPRMESKEDILERCRHAMWLIRLVESSGIELGPEWKEDVVVRSVQKLTGQSEEAIEKEMSVEGAVRSESSQSKPRIKSRTRTRAKVRARARARRSRNQP